MGMGSVLLNGAVLEAGCMLGAGSLVTEGTVIPSGMLAFGRPTKPVRPLTPEEREGLRESARRYVQPPCPAGKGTGEMKKGACKRLLFYLQFCQGLYSL